MPLNKQERSSSAFKVDVNHDRLGGFLKALGIQNANLLNFEIESLRGQLNP